MQHVRVVVRHATMNIITVYKMTMPVWWASSHSSAAGANIRV